MKQIELEATIDSRGTVHIPEKYADLYGKPARIIVVLQEEGEERQPREPHKTDLMKYSGTLNWPMDGVEYQRSLRDEWD